MILIDHCPLRNLPEKILMSLEENVLRLAVAIEALNALMVNSAAPAGTQAAASTPKPRAKAAPPVAAAQDNLAIGATATTVAAAPQTAAKPGAVPPTNTIPGYEKVREAVLSTAEKYGHPKAVEILARFGVKSGKELKPTQYEDFLKAVAELSSPALA